MKEVLMNKCEDENEYMRSMATKMMSKFDKYWGDTNLMMSKFDKYWGDTNLMMSIAAVLDPRYKMKLINFCFPIMYPLPPNC
jgi:hypothetical protein